MDIISPQIYGVILATVLSALPQLTQAQAIELKLIPGDSAEVTEVVDGDTIKLKHAVGRNNMVSNEIRLVGIQAPKLPLGRRNFKTWPLADQAKAALEKLSLGKKVRLSYGGRRMDRHGRLLAHLHLEDGTWLQGEMLTQGLARVYSFPDNRAAIPEMLAREKTARHHKRGIWQIAFYNIHQATELDRIPNKFKNSFQLVEGRVLDVAIVGQKIFINFGYNWRTDFTIALNPRAVKLFAQTGLDPLSLKNKNIRVRGWLKSYNGPMINATHPEQIEVLSK